MPAGRPTKYDPAFCERIPELMKDGLSIEEVACELGIVKSTLYEWVKKSVQFSNALKEGEELSKGWWLKKGRVNLENGKFNSTLWYMNMKNRHGWADKTEVELSNLPELGERLAKALERRAAYGEGE